MVDLQLTNQRGKSLGELLSTWAAKADLRLSSPFDGRWKFITGRSFLVEIIRDVEQMRQNRLEDGDEKSAFHLEDQLSDLQVQLDKLYKLDKHDGLRW